MIKNLELLERLLKQQEEDTFLFILNCCLKLGIAPITDNKNYIYIEDKKAAVCLVSHIDTVRDTTDEPVTLITYNKNVIRNSNGVLGADDRVGVYLMLSNLLYNTSSRVSYLFTTGEESGCLGAKQFIKDIKKIPDKLQIFIELDRQGIYNYVCYHESIKEINTWLRGFGFHEEAGSCSDITYLCAAYDVPGVNISVGYFKQHRSDEYIYLPYLSEIESVLLPKLMQGTGKRYEIPAPPKTQTYFTKNNWFYDKNDFFYKDDDIDDTDDTLSDADGAFILLEELFYYELLNADFTCIHCNKDHTKIKPCKRFIRDLKSNGYYEEWKEFYPVSDGGLWID